MADDVPDFLQTIDTLTGDGRQHIVDILQEAYALMIGPQDMEDFTVSDEQVLEQFKRSPQVFVGPILSVFDRRYPLGEDITEPPSQILLDLYNYAGEISYEAEIQFNERIGDIRFAIQKSVDGALRRLEQE